MGHIVAKPTLCSRHGKVNFGSNKILILLIDFIFDVDDRFGSKICWSKSVAMKERCQLLDAAVLRLERSEGNDSSEGLQRWTSELCELATKWGEDEDEDDADEVETAIFLRLEETLVKLPTDAQEQIVVAFRPLRAEVSRRLAEWTNEFNDWLSDAGAGAGNTSSEHIVELLREVETSPQLRWYRQCRKARVKAKFLMAVANLVRALLQKSPLIKHWVDDNPSLTSLAQKIVNRLFVLPGLGNVLETWHEGRLACYNATLSLAAQRAADKMKDDLQVSLVSAVKRSAAAPSSDGRAKGALQIQLREWPMSGCPLARALLEFLKSHAVDLGDLGRPSLRECPPHSLQPATLRNLLSRLDAFDLGPGPTSLVRLRFEAVAALAYKAVGTKPKAGTVAPPKPQQNMNNSGSPSARPSPPTVPSPVEIVIDYNDVSSMSRLIRRGLRAGDEEWRQAWTQFCWKKNISSRLSSRNQIAPPKDALVTFVESNMQKIQRAPWARDLLDEDVRESSLSRDVHSRPGGSMGSMGGSIGSMGGSGRKRENDGVRHEVSHRENAARDESDWSSSFSESRSRRRKKRRREKKYRDFFNSKNMTPEVMMMRAQMMGVSMVMNSPLAMMGMRNPIMPMTGPSLLGSERRTDWRQMAGQVPPSSRSSRATAASTPPPAPPAPPVPPAPSPAVPAAAPAPAPGSVRSAIAALGSKPLAKAAIDMDDL